MPIDLYYSYISAPSRAVLMTAKQLGIDVNVINIDLKQGQQFKPDFIKLNPTHKVPFIVDGDLVLWESRAIIQYLCNRYAPDSHLYPRDPTERAIVDRWLFTDMSYFETNINAKASQMMHGTDPTERDVANYKSTLQLLDTLIGDNRYAAGGQHLTIADLSLLATTVILSVNYYRDLDDYPHLKAWFTRLSKELPYFDDINDKVGEGWRKWAQDIADKK
ncbi:unnamed protein product [Medioppia subpectinata]|uniref:Glutathione S-transferase n=1 Tax=Medioppia subpectinata TaxID=1979941 RepID=A0A7R9KGM6_9ACAR|nr:unnamed protein product [Medioppia subpectinata]CAG2103003.1 unnamed protein product [Medioppia subpectinata]